MTICAGFASFLFCGFTTMAVINTLKSILAKRTSVAVVCFHIGIFQGGFREEYQNRFGAQGGGAVRNKPNQQF